MPGNNSAGRPLSSIPENQSGDTSCWVNCLPWLLGSPTSGTSTCAGNSESRGPGDVESTMCQYQAPAVTPFPTPRTRSEEERGSLLPKATASSASIAHSDRSPRYPPRYDVAQDDRGVQLQIVNLPLSLTQIANQREQRRGHRRVFSADMQPRQRNKTKHVPTVSAGDLSEVLSVFSPNRMVLKNSGTSSVLVPQAEDDDFCPTCLDPYSVENPKIWTKCRHHFHMPCIYEWMERSDRCPMCEQKMVFPELED